MIGVVSLLTGAAFSQVLDRQRSLGASYGLSCGGLCLPHLTYALAPGPAGADLVERLAALAAGTEPFEVEMSGLGLFTGPQPVLYQPVSRNAALAAVQAAIADLLEEIAGGVHPYYRPGPWLPHVTLASEGPGLPNLVAAVTELIPQEISLSARLTGLWLAEQTEPDRWELGCEFPFRGQSQSGPPPDGLSSA